MIEFVISQVSSFTSRGWIVLTGNILSGKLTNNLCLVLEEQNTLIEIMSIEAINSKDALLGLVFNPKNDQEKSILSSLQAGNVIRLSKTPND